MPAVFLSEMIILFLFSLSISSTISFGNLCDSFNQFSYGPGDSVGKSARFIENLAVLFDQNIGLSKNVF